MSDEKKMIKDDINFLEYPNWTISKKKKLTSYCIQKQNGKYEVLSPLGLPKHFDKIVVYFLLYKLYRESNLSSYTLITNRYEIAKNIFGGSHFSKNVYDRIMKAIKKWKSISINFEGIFYEGDGYTVRGFSIIDEYVLRKETGEFKIKFSESYIRQLQETKFYKLIDFEQYKKLHKTSSARLYEVLVKNFKDRNLWAIGIQALAEKLTFEKRESAQKYYPSDVLRYLRPSINEINRKTNLSIKFEYNKETTVCVFKEVPKQKELYLAAVTTKDNKKNKSKESNKQIADQLEKFKTLSIEEQEKILYSIKIDPFISTIPDQEAQITAMMDRIQKK